MYPFITGHQNQVYLEECYAFQRDDLTDNGGPAGGSTPPPGLPRGAIDGSNPPGEAEWPSIDTLATGGFTDTIPENLEAHYDEDDVRALRAMLTDTNFSAQSATIAELIGRLSKGSEADVDALIAFAASRAPGAKEISGPAAGLGILVNRFGNSKAFDYLVGMSRSTEAHRVRGSVYGLALSGRADAIAHLRRLQSAQSSALGVDRNVVSAETVGAFLDDAVFVAERGVQAYQARPLR